MRRPAAIRGFTLLEVMIALGIVAVIAGLVYGSFSPTYQAKQEVEKQAERYHGLRLAMGRMSREISMAFLSDRYDAKRYRERPTRFVANDGGDHDELLFTSFAHERLYEDAKEGDQAVIEYRIDDDPENRDQDALIRREKTVIDDQPDDGGQETVLVSGVEGLNFEYWDVEEEEWVDDWDTTDVEHANSLPERVRITLIAKGEDGKKHKYTTQTMIVLQKPLGGA